MKWISYIFNRTYVATYIFENKYATQKYMVLYGPHNCTNIDAWVCEYVWIKEWVIVMSIVDVVVQVVMTKGLPKGYQNQRAYQLARA